MVIDCHAGEIRFKGETDGVPGSNDEPDESEAHTAIAAPVQGPVDIARRQVVRAMTEMWVEGQVSATEPVFLGGFKLNEAELMVANSVDTPVDGRVHFLALNPHPRDVAIEEGQRIATWESLAKGSTVLMLRSGPKLYRLEPAGGVSHDAVIEVGETLTETQIDEVRGIVSRYPGVFSFDGSLGKTSLDEHVIELLPDSSPFIEPLRRRSEKECLAVDQQVTQMLELDIIEPSKSSWASAYVLVKKKDGSIRFCVDFRRLNKKTKTWCYPLPRCDQILDATAGKKYYTSLDLNSGYWQVPVAESSRQYTSFRCLHGQYQFKRMPFGLVNAGATFQRLMSRVIGALKSAEVLVYLDDVIVFSDSWHDHVRQLEMVINAFHRANLTVKPSKCVFGASKLKFLGHLISGEGMKPDPDKVKALRELPRPRDITTLRSFLGAAGYYRRFVFKFAAITAPLAKLTRKDEPFIWGKSQEAAFLEVRNKLLEAAVTNFDNQKPSTLKTDASYSGIAGILKQDDHIVTCVSRALSKEEKNYSVTHLEGLALVWCLVKLRPYVIGTRTTVIVDHCALCALGRTKPLTGRLARWAVILSEFQLEIVYAVG